MKVNVLYNGKNKIHILDWSQYSSFLDLAKSQCSLMIDLVNLKIWLYLVAIAVMYILLYMDITVTADAVNIDCITE